MFSEMLLKLRRERGMSQEELGALIGVSRQAVSKWETGEAMPDLHKLLALSDVLQVSLDTLCGREAPLTECSDPPKETTKNSFVWQILCAVLMVAVIFLSLQLFWPGDKNDVANDVAIDMEVREATFYSGNGHRLRYCIAPDSINSACSYQLVLTPETAVAGAPNPINLDASSGVFQGEIAFPLTASTWSVSLRVTSPTEVEIVPVAVGLYYKGNGMVSWDLVAE